MTFGIALIRFALFCVIVGIVLMIVGMAIPRRVRPDAFPLRPWRCEAPVFQKAARVALEGLHAGRKPRRARHDAQARGQ